MKQQSQKKMSSPEQQQHINPTHKIQDITHEHSSSTFPEATDLSDQDGHAHQDEVANSSLIRPSSECKKLIIIWLLSISVVMVLISVKKQYTTLQQVLMDGEVEFNKSLPLETNELSNDKPKSDKTQTEQNWMPVMLANQQQKTTPASQLNKPLSILKIDKTQQQLKNIIKQMKNPNYRTIMNKNFGKSTRLQDEVYFAFQLSRQPQNQEYLQAQYYYYNQKYNLSAVKTEVPICAVMVGRNLGGKYSKMIESVMRQNYSNFHIAFVDDNSDDGTKQNVQNYIKFNKDLQQRTTFIWQHKQMHALYNRNAAIRDICRKGDIVIDLDSDDWLIGNQVFQIVNSIYQNSDTWACYFNNIVYSKSCRCPLMNVDTTIPLQVLKQNKYRTSKYWRTTELRTFRKDLYDKIDQKDFVDQKGQFYEKKSDAFIQFPIVELAGSSHIKFLDEFLYFYESTFSKSSSMKTFCRLAAKAGTPYLPLKSLKDRAMKIQNYQPPQDIKDSLNKIKKELGYN